MSHQLKKVQIYLYMYLKQSFIDRNEEFISLI